ncbi:hypothetical protein PVK06_002770 [Gossypium arboreum]|uniref:Uncharacterized protein n=1 Tax=Gossypium arboreum TaxID=29729 RepID=A0ABR0R4F7_GOSAR|nr:hypothetical protein PVK06_002770 [Gossypium arboreum]
MGYIMDAESNTRIKLLKFMGLNFRNQIKAKMVACRVSSEPSYHLSDLPFLAKPGFYPFFFRNNHILVVFTERNQKPFEVDCDMLKSLYLIIHCVFYPLFSLYPFNREVYISR